MRNKEGRIGMLRVTVWSHGKPTASIREGRYIDKGLANADWGSGPFHRILYPLDIDACDIPVWHEATGNYVRFKISSGGKAVLYYNPKKRL